MRLNHWSLNTKGRQTIVFIHDPPPAALFRRRFCNWLHVQSHPFDACLIALRRLTLPSGRAVEIAHCTYEFTPWCGDPLPDTYGGKAVLDFEGHPVFAEVGILRLLEKQDWDGVWVDTYRRKFRKDLSSRDSVTLPEPVKLLFERLVEANGGQKGFWDVISWQQGHCLFIESKRKGRDSIRLNQLRWLESALGQGLPPDSFLIFEWNLKSPSS